MNITDEMIARAKEAYAASVMSGPHADSMRAALAAALAVQPAGELTVTRREDGSIAAVTRTDDEHRVLSVIAQCERKPAEPAEPGFVQQIAAARESVQQWPEWVQAAAVTATTQPARVPLIVPEESNLWGSGSMGEKLANVANAVPQPVALPALPVGAAETFVRFPDNGDRCQYRLSDLLTTYAREALAAAGVTVADGGAK